KRFAAVFLAGYNVANGYVAAALYLGNAVAKLELDVSLVLSGDLHNIVFALFPNGRSTGNISQVRLTLRSTDFEQLFYTGQTLCGVVGHSRTRTVLGVQGQLSTRLTDGLSSDNADRVTACNC